MDAMEALALATCYPSGIPGPSITGRPIDIAQGWVIAEDLDKGLAAGESFVSIYAMPSSTSKLPVPLSTGSLNVVSASVHGMTVSVSGATVLLTGAPGIGEYATILFGDVFYSAVAVLGSTVQSVAADLAAQASGTSSSDLVSGGAIVTIPTNLVVEARIGAPGGIAEIIDREESNVMVGVWTPTPADRTTIARALRVAIAQNLVVAMPDTSISLWRVVADNWTDKNQNELAFRRDITVRCQVDTVDTFPAYEVTVVEPIISLDPDSGQSFVIVI